MIKKIAYMLAILLAVMFLGACTPVQVGGELVLMSDGSGSRKFVLYLYDSDNNDGYGNAFYFSALHGEALKSKIEQTLNGALGESGWITVSIETGTGLNGNGKQVPTELVSLNFDFTSFEDYVNKMTYLAKFGGNSLPAGSKFEAPALVSVRDGTVRYRESAETTLWTVKPLFLALFDDTQVLDFRAGGRNTKAELKDLREYGLEMKGVGITLALGASSPKTVISGTNINEVFSWR